MHGYIKRQLKQVEQFKKLEEKRIPDDIDYDQINSLRIEAVQKLKLCKPIQLDRLPVFPAYLLQISLYCLYIWNREECRIMENKVWNRNYSILLIKSMN